MAFGIPFCLAVGPVFFLLIQVGVNKGLKFALGIACGVVLADVVLINTTYFFIDAIHLLVLKDYFIIECLCITTLLIMGIFTIFRETKMNEEQQIVNKTAIVFFLNGFILDVFNPSNIFVWIGVNAKIIKYTKLQHLLFYAGAVMTIAFLMIMLGFLASKIKKYLNAKILKRVNLILGVMYIILAMVVFLNIESGYNIFL